MTEIRKIHNAMLRLSCIGRTQFQYDPANQIFGDGEVHYLVEVAGLFFIGWEDNHTRAMIVNPITRFDLDELVELGMEEAWMVLNVPAELDEGIQFREIDDSELIAAYRQMELRTPEVAITAGRPALSPLLQAL